MNKVRRICPETLSGWKKQTWTMILNWSRAAAPYSSAKWPGIYTRSSVCPSRPIATHIGIWWKVWTTTAYPDLYKRMWSMARSTWSSQQGKTQTKKVCPCIVGRCRIERSSKTWTLRGIPSFLRQLVRREALGASQRWKLRAPEAPNCLPKLKELTLLTLAHGCSRPRSSKTLSNMWRQTCGS